MTVTTAALEKRAGPPARTDRFRPTRSGVINVWDYVDEEFAFAGGRLALRGHNGSGKTKALEVLFPFVLDGVADSRRLDPFSGENRTMKSNLLYRGQEAEYGYVWMEFARPGETVTLVIGLRAHRNRDGVKTSFFVTGKRLGIEFGLLSADSRPLTERQLKAVLEAGAWHRTATDSRDAVDARLFGLGRERYSQLLDLLLALRRPLLAKDLDPGKVSDTLTSGLSPVDDDLVQQAARDFENLAAVQKLFDDLTAANAAVGEFLTHYTGYLKSHARFQLDRVQARAEAVGGYADRIAAATAEYRRAVAAEQQAKDQRDARKAEEERLNGRLTGLKNSDEYKAQGRLEAKRREVSDAKQAIENERGRLGRDLRHIKEMGAESAKLASRVAEARVAEGKSAAKLTDAAQRSGIAGDGSGPVDTGDDLPTTARAREVARRDDVREIRRQLEAVGKAEASRAHAEMDVGRKEATEQEQERKCREADDRLAQARRTAAAKLAAWADRWLAPHDNKAADSPDPEARFAGSGVSGGSVIGAGDIGVLAGALERIGEAGASSLAEVFAELISERRAMTITARANLANEVGELRKRLDNERAKREAIASERDDAPRSTDLRIARRDGPGAPLWQLVRFADGVDERQAAAVEGALYGAGLLTAWVHPDPGMTQAALAATEPDGYLIAAHASSRPGQRTLADILVPEDQDKVDVAVVAAVLRSIQLNDDLTATAGTSEAGETATAAGSQGPLLPVVTTRAQFSYGVHAGARPKPAPEYIGATNRANRRRARLAEIDEYIARAAEEEKRLASELARADALLVDFKSAQRQLPDTAQVVTAVQAVSTNAALLAAARAELNTARNALDTAIAEVDAKARLLRQAAAERSMPTVAEQVDAIAQAIDEFAAAATQLCAERAKVKEAEGDLAQRSETIDRLNRQYEESARAAAVRERAQDALAEQLRTLEATLGTDVQQVLAQIRQTDALIDAARKAHDEQEATRGAEHDKGARADENLKLGRDSLTEAIGQLCEQAMAFGPYTLADLRPLIGVTHPAPWPPNSQWPKPGAASDNLAGVLMHGSVATDAEGPSGTGQARVAVDATGAVRAVLPTGVVEILDAYQAATRGGRAVTEGTLKNTAERMSGALKEFTEALAACDEDYRVEWDAAGVVTVRVLDADGRSPVANFATRIADRAEEQGILLEERERTVLEDELLTGLAQQIHSRVIAARDLVHDMDEDTRSKPMSSGIAVGIRWVQSDKTSDKQRAASRLLERDAVALGPDRLAELRAVLREMIKEYRASHPRATYREALGNVLDYRSWHAFELLLAKPGADEVKLTRAKHSVMSGGEKSASIHLPLFAAANALYSSAKPHCPRMIALDEAFVGIDERYKPDLFGLAVKFDLDLFMTGHDLWVTYPTVPLIAHYDMHHDKTTHTVSSLLMLWDGEHLLDANAGLAGNDELAAELLGFRPTRHAPLGGNGAMLYANTAGDEEGLASDEDDEDGDDTDGDA